MLGVGSNFSSLSVCEFQNSLEPITKKNDKDTNYFFSSSSVFTRSQTRKDLKKKKKNVTAKMVLVLLKWCHLEKLKLSPSLHPLCFFVFVPTN